MSEPVTFTVDALEGLLLRYVKEVFPRDGDPKRVREKVVDWPENMASHQVKKFLRWVKHDSGK